MTGDATVDSYVRFMGPVLAGYGLGWCPLAATSVCCRVPGPRRGRSGILRVRGITHSAGTEGHPVHRHAAQKFGRP
jgi:hypothetical protein